MASQLFLRTVYSNLLFFHFSHQQSSLAFSPALENMLLRGFWVSFVATDEFWVRVTKKLFQGFVSQEHIAYFTIFDPFLTHLMPLSFKGQKRDNFGLHNPLRHSFTRIWGLGSNFVECECFLELNSPEILAVCETNLDDSIYCDNFSMRVNL